jgi:NAD+ synthase (glutamine-hydrolysing)
LSLSGVQVIGNGSGSHHELRKLDARMNLMVNATKKCGGIYLYANQRGCDGGRLYFDGCSMIVVNGVVVAQAEQFGVEDVTVLVATVNVDDVLSYRTSLPSLGVQASQTITNLTQITCREARLETPHVRLTQPIGELRYHSPEEECCLGPACWLWDYLRRSGASGFLLPLSGGADSSCVATIVGVMCRLVVDAAPRNPQVEKDVRRICGDMPSSWLPESPQILANSVLHTIYMGTENSSNSTETRALILAQDNIGAYHLTIKIDAMVEAVLQVFSLVTGKTPQFSSRGGTIAEDLALQNIQARLRMVTAYLFAQLLPWIRSRKGFLLVLGSANVDEGLRGYMTKYDCSSADLNPIGAISKIDLRRMLLFYSQYYPVLKEIAGAPPTAELRPNAEGEGAEHSQLGKCCDKIIYLLVCPITFRDYRSIRINFFLLSLDEDEMGMTYDELGDFGRLRKLSRCGPVTMYRKLVLIWQNLAPAVVAEKVKHFFYYYSINRHKMCTITPSYHAEAYNPDDNRFDLRQFLYNSKWDRQFSVIDKLANEDETMRQTQT